MAFDEEGGIRGQKRKGEENDWSEKEFEIVWLLQAEVTSRTVSLRESFFAVVLSNKISHTNHESKSKVWAALPNPNEIHTVINPDRSVQCLICDSNQSDCHGGGYEILM